MGQVTKEIKDGCYLIELNADNRIHVHCGRVRLDLSIEEFETFRQHFLEASKELKKRHGFDKK